MNWLLLIFGLFLSACTTLPSPSDRNALADSLARQQGWQATRIKTLHFDLVAYLPVKPAQAEQLTVYIEGDGFAWVSPSQPSNDPTPRDPLALRLALMHPGGNAAYLARPCQYTDAKSSGCLQRYWTEGRFAPEVIEASSAALDEIKRRFGAQQLSLVGYSGGGAVAALLAARRSDVEKLITVAGNLDHRAWTAHHQIQALTGSLNPADEIEGLKLIRQWHFVGEQDKIMPPFLVQGFAKHLIATTPQLVVRVEPDYDHRCCWVENWPVLISSTQVK
jgi:hypothetical protein